MEIKRPTLGIYMTLGYPDVSKFSEILENLAPYVGFYEIGIPTRNPKYDGPTIRTTHYHMVRSGITGLEALKLLDKIEIIKPFTIMAYLSEFIAQLRLFLEEAAAVGALCVLFPDLAFEYPEMIDKYIEESERVGLRTCFFASSRFPHQWLRLYAALNPLYIYLGLQPATGIKLPIFVEKNVRIARLLIGDRYLVVGFAIRTPEVALSLIKNGADAIVIGSAIIERIINNDVKGAVELAHKIHASINIKNHPTGCR